MSVWKEIKKNYLNNLNDHIDWDNKNYSETNELLNVDNEENLYPNNIIDSDEGESEENSNENSENSIFNNYDNDDEETKKKIIKII